MQTICDHPGWDADSLRAVRTPAGPAIAAADTTGINLHTGHGHVDLYDPAHLSDRVPPPLRRALDVQGPVARLRNPDLWDAVATAIIRQVIRADQARLMYQRFTAAFGDPVEHAGRRLRLFPAPDTVLAVSDEQFSALGMAFKRRPLRAAALAHRDLGAKWAELAPEDLVDELQAVPRIGPWTAGAAVADHTGDFSLYPYGDLAVRTHARRTAPELELPADEPGFAARWRAYADTPGELSALTVLTLALGGTRAKDRPPA
jgi:DNA-3-methyladenine glycosylase II